MFSIRPLLPTRAILRDCVGSWTTMRQTISLDPMGRLTRTPYSLQNHVSNMYCWKVMSFIPVGNSTRPMLMIRWSHHFSNATIFLEVRFQQFSISLSPTIKRKFPLKPFLPKLLRSLDHVYVLFLASTLFGQVWWFWKFLKKSSYLLWPVWATRSFSGPCRKRSLLCYLF